MKGVKKKLVFSLLAMAIFFILLEIGFRISFFIRYNDYGTSPAIQGSPLQMPDEKLIFRNRPFYLDKNKNYQFNAEGFKSAPGDINMPPKKPGDFWVFLFGASAMEGMGSNQDGDWLDITGVRDHPYHKSVTWLLQQKLTGLMSGSRVRVFSAANSGFSIYQSTLQYERLKSLYKMDFVISMDGTNEPMIDDTSITVRQVLTNQWNDYPIFRSPLKYVIPLAKSSAFINALKQGLFEAKMAGRLEEASAKNFPVRQQWLQAKSPALAYAENSGVAARSVDSFFYYAGLFERTLMADSVPHLLYLQPHLTLKKTTALTPVETALLNYYRSGPLNDAVFNTYMKQAYSRATSDTASPLLTMDFMLTTTSDTFVDYCHFTDTAIERLSEFFAGEITRTYQLKQGRH